MKKMYVLMALCLLCATNMRAMQSGSFEEGNSKWTFDNGVLTISVLDDDPENEFMGFGMIPDFEVEGEEEDMVISSPWWSFKDDIESIVIEEGIVSIGEYAFPQCFYVESLTLPINILRIGRSAFYACTSLTELTIPTVTLKDDYDEYYVLDIESYAFAGCIGIELITCYQPTPPEYAGNSFAGMNVANITVYVPEEYLEDYEESDWSEFDLKAIPDLCEVSYTGQWKFIHSQMLPASNGEVSFVFFTKDDWYYDVDHDKLVTPGEGMALMLTIRPDDESWMVGTYNADDKLVIGDQKSTLFVYNDGDRDFNDVISGSVTIAANATKDAYEFEYDLTILMWGTTEQSYAGNITNVCADEIKEPEPPVRGIQNVLPAANSQKVLRNGQLLIERNGKIFNALGTEMR